MALCVRELCVDVRDEPSGSERRIVDDVTLKVAAGATLGLVGESGSGKSITLMSIMGLLPAGIRVSHGQVRICGNATLDLSTREMRRLLGRQVAAVFQDPRDSFDPLRTVGYQLAEAIRSHDGRLPRHEVRSKAIDLLRRFGLPDADTCFSRYPHQYSGGMLQRAMLAIALASEPKLILADEPTTALDVTTQQSVLQLLKEIQTETGAAIVFVTHNLSLVATFADRIAVMYSSRIVEEGPAQEIIEAPRHHYTRALIGCVPKIDATSKRLQVIPGYAPQPGSLPSGCTFHPRCLRGDGAELCRSVRPRLSDASGHTVACHFPIEEQRNQLDTDANPRDLEVPQLPSRPAGGPTASIGGGGVLVSAEQLVVRYRVRHATPWRRLRVRAVNGVSFALRAGGALGVVGETGSGKSSLARAVALIDALASGRITYRNGEVSGMSLRRLRKDGVRRQVQLLVQDAASSLDPQRTIGATVIEALPCNLRRRAAIDRAARLLDEVGLGQEYLDRYPRSLSGGQQRRIAIARALAADPSLLILDEPTSALDVSVQAQVVNILADLKADRDLTYIVITHDMAVASHLCQDIIVMYAGKVVEAGRTEDVLHNPRHPYTQALLSAVPSLGKPTNAILIPGEAPTSLRATVGCPFKSRCWKAEPICGDVDPKLAGGTDHVAACHFADW